MLEIRHLEANGSSHAVRAPQAFVADYDDAIGAVARVTEDIVRPRCQTAVQWLSERANRASGKTLIGADTMTRTSSIMARGAGMAVMAGGAAFAAEACVGAFEKAQSATEARNQWRYLAEYPANALHKEFAEAQAKRSQTERIMHLLGAGGGAAMSATLLCSPTLLGLVTSPTHLVLGAAACLLYAGRSLPPPAKLKAKDVGNLIWNSIPLRFRRDEPLASLLAVVLKLTASTAISRLLRGLSGPASFALTFGAWAGLHFALLATPSERRYAIERVREMVGSVGEAGRTGIMAVVTSALCVARIAGASTPMLNAACLGASIGLMSLYAIANIVHTRQQAQSRAESLERFHAAFRQAGLSTDVPQEQALLDEVHGRYKSATRFDFGIQASAVVMMAGLVGQTVAMWPGVLAILAGSVAMECARYGRDARVPPIEPYRIKQTFFSSAMLQRTPPELETSKRRKLGKQELKGNLSRWRSALGQRDRLVERQRLYKKQMSYRQWLFGTRDEHVLEKQALGLLNFGKFATLATPTEGAFTKERRADQARRITDALFGAGRNSVYLNALGDRLVFDSRKETMPSPQTAKQYRYFLKKTIELARYDLLPLLDASAADLFQDLLTSPNLVVG